MRNATGLSAVALVSISTLVFAAPGGFAKAPDKAAPPARDRLAVRVGQDARTDPGREPDADADRLDRGRSPKDDELLVLDEAMAQEARPHPGGRRRGRQQPHADQQGRSAAVPARRRGHHRRQAGPHHRQQHDRSRRRRRRPFRCSASSTAAGTTRPRSSRPPRRSRTAGCAARRTSTPRATSGRRSPRRTRRARRSRRPIPIARSRRSSPTARSTTGRSRSTPRSRKLPDRDAQAGRLRGRRSTARSRPSTCSSSPALFKKLQSKLVRSYITEAIDVKKAEGRQGADRRRREGVHRRRREGARGEARSRPTSRRAT